MFKLFLQITDIAFAKHILDFKNFLQTFLKFCDDFYTEKKFITTLLCLLKIMLQFFASFLLLF
jgi:hypothetical protein